MTNSTNNNDRLVQIKNDYQLVIIGGGIYGAALCWEATHRGINTLLIEKNDYACGASSNSLKTIHGGLRSLQSLNLFAVLKGIRERDVFLRIAPNYVKPLACILPTTSSLMKSKPVVGMGLLLYNILNGTHNMFSDNKYIHGKPKIPTASLLSQKKFFEHAPNINAQGITGGALWHDAQVKNTERLVWQFVRAAIKYGADAINHTAAVKHEYLDGQHKLLLRDQINGNEKSIYATAVVDASAAWNFIKQCLPEPAKHEDLTFLKSINIIVNKNLFATAVGANTKNKKNQSRLYFFAPWRNRTIIGTWYSKAETYPEYSFSSSEAETCINEINAAFEQPLLTVNDICNVHIGFLPASKNNNNKPENLDKNLYSRYHLKDWSLQTGADNLFSLRGTKYTLARNDAQQVVDHLARKLKWKVGVSQSDHLPLHQDAPTLENTYALSSNTISYLSENYGKNVKQLFSFIKKQPQLSELIPGTKYHIAAEIHYSVFYEQALTLCDLLKRRLAIGDREPPAQLTAEYCAKTMQQLLCWTNETMHAEINNLYASYPDFLTRKANSV